MKKRLLPALLALALCTGLATVPAFAVDIRDATREDIKNTFTIMRNGTVDETKRVYTSSKRVPLDSYAEGFGHVAYEVFDENDSWTITNTGSKAISANGSTDYTISFGYCTYGRGYDTDVMEEIGGSGMMGLDENSVPHFVYGDAPANPVNLKAGESVTIPASALGDSSPEQTIYELLICITYDVEDWDDPTDIPGCVYTFYFGYDPAEKAAIEKNLGNQPAPSFTDVPSWCAAAVDWAVAEKITDGTGNNKFSPNNQCTNAMILTFLWRAAGEPDSSAALPVDISGKNIAYAETALRWAAEKGMVGAGFDPLQPCTRGSAVTYIWKAFDEIGADGHGFNDIPPGDETLNLAVNFAAVSGIANGYDNGDGTFSFRPDKVCSRGEIVTFLHRAYVPEASLAAGL